MISSLLLLKLKYPPSCPDINGLTMSIRVEYFGRGVSYAASERVQLFVRRMEVFRTKDDCVFDRVSFTSD